MTSSSCWFYNVTKILQQKNRRFWRVLAEYLKNASTNFHQTYVMFRQLCTKVFQIKISKMCHWLLPWWSIHKGVLGLKSWFKLKKWHFLKISSWYCVFELRLEIKSPKLPLTPNFSLIHPKTKKPWRLSPSWVVTTSKWRLWRHIFELKMTSSILKNFTRLFLPGFSIIWLE